MRRKREIVGTILLLAVLIAGIWVLQYKGLKKSQNKSSQSESISRYAKAVAGIGKDRYDEILAGAHEYNKEVAEGTINKKMTREEALRYESMLNPSGNGLMGYLEISKIHCVLPICHGTQTTALYDKIGHMEGSSLPVGGENTHAVLSSHRSSESAELFTDLNRLKEGDTFVIRILDELLTYEVDQILVVEPEDDSNFGIKQNKDYCTLVGTTPYGVNSHRLLVRGHRIENEESVSRSYVTADGAVMEPMAMLLGILTFLLAGMVIILVLRSHEV